MEKLDNTEREEITILRELIELSEKQLHLMGERRLEELLGITAQREKRFEELKRILSERNRRDPELKRLVKTLLEKDGKLTLNIESELQNIKEKIYRIPTRLKALRTYTRIQGYNSRG